MSRIGLMALAALLTGAIAGGGALAQSPPSQAQRAAVAAKYNHKMPACKAEANKQKLLSGRRDFIKRCLKG
jgi:hypothetical protein